MEFLEWMLPPAFIVAALFSLVVIGVWLKNREPVHDGGDAAPYVPAACVVTAQRAYRFPKETRPTMAWSPDRGLTLLAIAAVAGFFFLVVCAMAYMGAGC